MALTGQQLTDAMEVHAIAVKRLENAARADLDAAYAKMAGRATLKGLPGVMVALREAARALITEYGKRAIAEAKRYTEEAFGIVGEPHPQALAAPVEDAMAMIQETGRHTRAILAIRTNRMLASGIAPAAVGEVVRQDFQHGGRTFSVYRSELKGAVAGAVQGLAQAQAMAALAPKERSGADAA